ncbi:VOC family protein [Psychroserpens sp. BH13MA-6]
MKYGYTIIYVKNVKEMLAFYEKAFGFKKNFITPVSD